MVPVLVVCSGVYSGASVMCIGAVLGRLSLRIARRGH